MATNNSNLVFSQYVDELVQNSECFSFDAYNVGLRRYIKQQSRSGELGNLQMIEVDPKFQEINPACLLLGETNRLSVRYPLIQSLLDSTSRNNSKNSDYYKALWRYYEGKKFTVKIKGKLEIRRKIDRIYRMDSYIKESKTLEGIHSYLIGVAARESRHDYPINLIYDLDQEDKVIQLDGSHRRSICYYNGISYVKSINTRLSDTLSNIDKHKEPYLHNFKDKFLSVLNCFNA
ncbi:hypothetical protein LSUCC1028_03870 [Rhodobacterales bacterium LSUCC1028]|nr:hypothetical protein [Rhodobacterales bacterium LSUCC1028]